MSKSTSTSTSRVISRAALALAIALAFVFAPIVAQAGTLKVRSMTVNGLKVVNLRCTLKGGGFMAAMVVVSGLAKQKKALQRCSKGKQTVQAAWRYAGGRIKGAKVKKASNGKVKRCVAKALGKVKSGKLSGSCSAGIVIGR